MRWKDTLRLKQPLKTAVASAGAMAAYEGLHLQHGYWAVISAIIVLQSNLGRSIRASSNRLIGTAIGATIGAVTFHFTGRSVGGLAIAVGLTIWVCTLARLFDSFRLAGVTASIVMLIGEGTALRTGVDRFVDVALGVLIALLVTSIWPSRARADLRKAIAHTFHDVAGLLGSCMDCVLTGNCDSGEIERKKASLTAQVARNAELRADVDREPRSGGREDRALVSLQQTVERIRGHIFGMTLAAQRMQADSFHRSLDPALRDVAGQVQQGLNAIAQTVASDKPIQPLPDLEPAIERLEHEFAALRQTGASLQFDFEELLRFYAFYYRLREVVEDLRGALRLLQSLSRDDST
jgi:uncharacterized membrane protein YccC